VIGPTRTRSGKPILANDPHLELRAPALWYLAALESPGLRVAGGTIPGLPGVIVGRNARIAWGLTNVELDDVDYVIERLNRDSSRVLTPDGWEPVEVVRDSIRVRGAAPVPFTLRRTAHGPLVAAPGEVTGRGEDTTVHALAMRWTGQEPSDELTALLGVNRAGAWEAFLEALEAFQAPEQNWVYADVDGNIGYALAGRVPVRRSGRGLLPTRGWTDEGRWERYLTFGELPRAFNPPEGFIVTANNRVVGPEYPHPLPAAFAQPWRAERIRELIKAGGAFTADDVRRMQLDSVDGFARWGRHLAAAAAAAAGRPDLAGRLEAWDGGVGTGRTEPTLFYAWYRALQRLTFEDDLGGTYAPAGPLQAWLRAGASPWFDDTRTAEREDLRRLAARAMQEALPHAERRWGEVHGVRSAHPLGRVPVLQRLLRLSIGPRPRAGALYTVNVAEFGSGPPFVTAHAASLRQVVDLADPESGRLVIPTGQGGHPLARRYRDQADLWWRGELLEVPLSGSRVRAAAVLRLVPEAP
jgi:penicillin amidase